MKSSFVSLSEFGRYYTSANKWNNWSSERFPKSSFIRSFPVCQEVVDVSLIAGSIPSTCHPIPIATIQLMFPLLLVEKLVQQFRLFSDWWGVAVRWFHDNCQILMNCPKNNFWLFVTALEIFVGSSPSPANSCSYTDKMYPLSGEILYHDSVPVIVPGFTSFTKNIVIRCCQVTKLGSLIAYSARNPRSYGS